MVSVLLSYFRTPRVQIAAMVYFLIAGALTRMPLFNYLGYEFSAVMTIPAAIISGVLTIKFMREHRSKPLTRRTWLFVLSDYLLMNTLLLLIPLAVISLNAFAVKNCAFGRGLLYYLLLTEGAMVFAVSLALVTGVIFRHGITVFIAATAGILAHILFVTVTQPQLFAFNFILGYFPGITYDEALSDLNQLILYREFTLIASLMMFALFIVLVSAFRTVDPIRTNLGVLKERFSSDKRLWSVIFLCASVIGTGHFFRAELGFEYSEEDIRNALGRRSESEHFVVYYNDEDHTAREIQVLKAESEFHYRTVREFLGVHENQKKISVYLYPTAEWKQRYIGTFNTNIAKPWKEEIHLTTATFASTFRHELVHILAAEFGIPLIGASTRMGLNEGLAVAADWDEGLFTPHEYAAALLREGALDDTERLFSVTGFAARSSSYAYLVSGSFSRYLIERFGMDRFRRVFPNGNFVSAFGETLESLVRDWKASLRSIDASSIPSETVRTLFFQPSIFYKTCAREVATQSQQGAAAYREREYRRAEEEYSKAFANAQTSGSLRGLMQSLTAQDRPAEALQRYNDLPDRSPLRMNPTVMMVAADALYLHGERDSARIQYRMIAGLNISEAFIESSVLKEQFIHDRLAPQDFHQLFYTGRKDPSRVRMIDSLLQSNSDAVSLSYLKSILLPSSDSLKTVLLKGLSTEDSPLRYFISIRCAEQSYRTGDYEGAKLQYWNAKNRVLSSALAERIDEKIEMCDFVMSEVQ
jgi:hypothetical protein